MYSRQLANSDSFTFLLERLNAGSFTTDANRKYKKNWKFKRTLIILIKIQETSTEVLFLDFYFSTTLLPGKNSDIWISPEVTWMKLFRNEIVKESRKEYNAYIYVSDLFQLLQRFLMSSFKVSFRAETSTTQVISIVFPVCFSVTLANLYSLCIYSIIWEVFVYFPGKKLESGKNYLEEL